MNSTTTVVRERTTTSHSSLWHLALAAITAWLGMSASTQAAPGDLDTGYGSSGYYVATAVDEAHASLVQPDNKLVLAGRCAPRSGAWAFCASRLTTTGVLDTSFGLQPTPVGRILIVAGDANSVDEKVASVARQPDGRIILGGSCTVGGNSQWCLVRLNTNGSVDSTFGTAGRVYIPAASGLNSTGPVTLATVRTQPDGKIVLGGSWKLSVSTQTLGVMRLNANGSLDTTFGAPDGYVALTLGLQPAGEFRVNAVSVRSDRRIVAAGHCERLLHGTFPNAYFTSQACLWFLNADGTPDNSVPGGAFGNIGISGSNGAQADNAFTAITQRADGTLVAAGTCGTTSAPRICYASLNLAQPSSTTGTSGGSAATAATAVAAVSDGRPLFIGTVDLSSSTSAFALSGLAPDFSGTFFGASAVGTPVAGGINQADAGGGLQSDGKILIAGNCGTSSARACATRVMGFPSNGSSCSLDIDGDGSFNALVDGLIVNRALLGLSGAAVTNNITFAANAVRTSWTDIRLFLVGQCGMTLP